LADGKGAAVDAAQVRAAMRALGLCLENFRSLQIKLTAIGNTATDVRWASRQWPRAFSMPFLRSKQPSDGRARRSRRSASPQPDRLGRDRPAPLDPAGVIAAQELEGFKVARQGNGAKWMSVSGTSGSFEPRERMQLNEEGEWEPVDDSWIVGSSSAPVAGTPPVEGAAGAGYQTSSLQDLIRQRVGGL
jgi:hypothetical protein